MLKCVECGYEKEDYYSDFFTIENGNIVCAFGICKQREESND